MAFFRRAELWACLGALAFAGCVITDDDGETEASTSGPSTMTTAPTSGDDDGSGTAGTMTAADGTADGTTAGDTAADTAGDTAGTTAGDTGPGGDATEACLAACELGSQCEKLDPAGCVASCEEDIGLLERDGCIAEAIPWWQCVSALDCAMYFEWLDEVDPYPCQAEDEAVFACEDAAGGTGTGGDSSGTGA